MQQETIILWFRQDLRIHDNRALAAAAATGASIFPLFVLDDELAGKFKLGGASRWWLHHSLASLDRRLLDMGGALTLLRGPAVDLIPQLAATCAAQAVYCSRCHEPWNATLEGELKKRLAADGREFKRYSGALLKEPEAIRTQSGAPFKVYTPFWRALRSNTPPHVAVAPPAGLTLIGRHTSSLSLDDLDLLPVEPDWFQGLRTSWHPGEGGAKKRLAHFLEHSIEHYDRDRDRPDKPGTSRLSPHLHWGEISPASCWHAAIAAAEHRSIRGLGPETFLKELAWREFSYHLLHHWPSLPEAPFRPEFARFPWQADDAHLTAWQRGLTGYPIVDAGMRQLWDTGWMHNRVRMVVASFLVKHLLIPWQQGADWFWDTLVDADLASNAASWQWVAGSGADAAPYFRIFNPVRQGQSFDPDGGYVRRWVPELARLPVDVIHAPWLAGQEELAKAGVVLGKTYPLPIVDHVAARNRALAALAQIRNGTGRGA